MSILLADIDATCASLGYNDGSKYYIEDDALQSLKVSDKNILKTKKINHRNYSI
jgi:hypothetical protein